MAVHVLNELLSLILIIIKVKTDKQNGDFAKPVNTCCQFLTTGSSVHAAPRQRVVQGSDNNVG